MSLLIMWPGAAWVCAWSAVYSISHVSTLYCESIISLFLEKKSNSKRNQSFGVLLALNVEVHLHVRPDQYSSVGVMGPDGIFWVSLMPNKWNGRCRINTGSDDGYCVVAGFCLFWVIYRGIHGEHRQPCWVQSHLCAQVHVRVIEQVIASARGKKIQYY